MSGNSADAAYVSVRHRRRDPRRRSLRRAVLGRAAPARRLRSASGKRLELRRARRAAAALRHRRDAGRLAAVIARHDPRMVIALGDSFHDRAAHERLSRADRDAIAAHAGAAATGSGSRAITIRQLPSDLGGVIASEVCDRRRSLPPRADRRARRDRRPSASQGAASPPAAAMERRCFASDGERAVMPAFGAYAGGLSIRDAAFAKIFPAMALSRMCSATAACTPSPPRGVIEIRPRANRIHRARQRKIGQDYVQYLSGIA